MVLLRYEVKLERICVFKLEGFKEPIRRDFLYFNINERTLSIRSLNHGVETTVFSTRVTFSQEDNN